MRPNYDLFLRWGIKEDVLLAHKCGFAETGTLKNRIVFPIINRRGDKIIGFNGRYYKEKTPPKVVKWKVNGPKKEFLYGVYRNDTIIREEKRVILVESLGDCLALENVGVVALPLFGIQISPAIINYISGIMGCKVIIATNNDSMMNNGGAGNNAAENIKKKLGYFLNTENILIRLPEEENDWLDYIKTNKAARIREILLK